MEKVVSHNDRSALQAEPEADITHDDSATKPREGKHYSFYFSILMLAMIALIVSWDVTALSLALPVSLSPRST